MITVLIATDTVHKQMVAIPLDKKGNKVVIQGDSQHALMAVVHDACALLDIHISTSLNCSEQRHQWSRGAVQSVEGMARSLRLDLLARTIVAVGSDLPITPWMVRHAAWLWSQFHAGRADGKTAYEPQFENTLRVICATFFSERVTWKAPALQLAKLRCSFGYGL